MWFNNVVFPLPRNPVKTVIGILSSSFLFDELLLFALLSSVCCSCSLVAARADRAVRAQRVPEPRARELRAEAWRQLALCVRPATPVRERMALKAEKAEAAAREALVAKEAAFWDDAPPKPPEPPEGGA